MSKEEIGRDPKYIRNLAKTTAGQIGFKAGDFSETPRNRLGLEIWKRTQAQLFERVGKMSLNQRAKIAAQGLGADSHSTDFRLFQVHMRGDWISSDYSGVEIINFTVATVIVAALADYVLSEQRKDPSLRGSQPEPDPTPPMNRSLLFGRPDTRLPGLDYYDNKRERDGDGSLVAHQGSFGIWSED